MAYVFGALVAGAYHNFDGVVHEPFGYFCNLGGHRCREEQHLALLGHMREDVVDGVDKAHVEHLVGLVENHGVYVVEVHHAAVYQVDEASRRGHDNLDALAEGANLALYRRAAVDGQHLKAGSVFGHIGQVAGNLQA